MNEVVTMGRVVMMRRAVGAVIGLATFIGAWELIGRTGVLTASWPPVSVVIETLVSSGSSDRLVHALGVTSRSGFAGAAFGVGAAAVLTLTVRLFAWAQKPAERFAVLVEAVPVVALGPLLMVLLPREDVPTALATTAAYFSAFVVLCEGLLHRSPEHDDLVRVLGASPRTILWRVDVPSAVPAFFQALQLAIPAALLGAVIGEWFGGSQGIGPLLISSMQSYDVPLLWAAGALTAIPAGLSYALAGALHRMSRRRFSL